MRESEVLLEVLEGSLRLRSGMVVEGQFVTAGRHRVLVANQLALKEKCKRLEDNVQTLEGELSDAIKALGDCQPQEGQ